MSWLLNPFRSGARGGGKSASPSAPGPSAPAAPSHAPQGGGGAATAVAPARQPSRPNDAWASLPPLHVLHGPPALLDMHFESRLASWQHPMFGLKPLGHLRSPAAPAGMVLLDAVAPQPAESSPAAPVQPIPPGAMTELPLPVAPPVVPDRTAAAPARPDRSRGFGDPGVDVAEVALVESDTSFVQAIVESPAELVPHSRFDTADVAAEPPAEGALRAVGAPEQELFESLRPRLEGTVRPVEEAADVAAPPPPPHPDLTLATPVQPPPEESQVAPEPPRPFRVRFGEPPRPDDEAAPAPPVVEALAEPPAIEAPAIASPAVDTVAPLTAESEPLVTGAEPAARESELPAAETRLLGGDLTLDLARTDGPERTPDMDDLAPVLGESEPLLPGIEGAADGEQPAPVAGPGDAALDLALRHDVPPESGPPTFAAPAPAFVDKSAAPVEAPLEPAAPAESVLMDPALFEAPPSYEPAQPPATGSIVPPAPPEVVPLLTERDNIGARGEALDEAAPVPPQAAAPAGGEMPLASRGAPVSPPTIASPPSTGEAPILSERPAVVVPPRRDIASPPAVTETPVAAAPATAVEPPLPLAAPAAPVARPPGPTSAEPTTLPSSQAPLLTGGEPLTRTAPPAGPAQAESTPRAPSEPAMPLAAPPGPAPVSPSAPPQALAAPPAAPEGRTDRALGGPTPPDAGPTSVTPILADRPVMVSEAASLDPAPETFVVGQPEMAMPLQAPTAQATATATLVREQVTVAPLLSERQMPLVSDAESDFVFPSRDPEVTVRVGRATDAAARQLRAKAFTHEGEVHVPSSTLVQGPREVEALVAHEMTHVMQQRILGPGRLPVESTSDGAALEAEARAVEQAVRATGDFSVPQTSPVAMDLARYGMVLPVTQAAPAAPDVMFSTQAVPQASLPPLTLPSLALPAPQAPAAAQAPPVVQVPEAPYVFHWEAPTAQVQRAPTEEGGASGGGDITAGHQPDEPGEPHWISTLDWDDKSELADELYPFFQIRLRDELRRHRDRTGRFNDIDL